MGRFQFLRFCCVFSFWQLLPKSAFAHLVNADVGVFYAGMLHPLTSAEHLLPTLAMALLASQSVKQASRVSMFLFPAALIVGLLVGQQFSAFGMAHPINLIVLILLGGLLTIARRINLATVVAAVLATGLILGYRSGVDMSNANVDLKFIPGVAFTGFIAVVLFSAWVPKKSSRTGSILLVLGGACFLVAGLFLFGKLLWDGNATIVRNIGFPTEESLTALVRNRKLTWPLIIGSLLGATAWGAAHALTPGHGKAVVAAYLIGSRSTHWHAVYLGLTVTATHTLSIYFLGLITLFASKYVMADQLYPLLGAVSGLVIIVLASSMMANSVRAVLRPQKNAHANHNHGNDSTQEHSALEQSHHNHHHHHNHLPPGTDGSAANWRSIIGLGISGGLLPCPSALVLLLTAVSLQRAGFGIVLVAAFSLGMAAVLMAVGLLFVKGSRLLAGTTRMSRISRYLPIGSAIIILCLGLILAFDSIVKISG